MARALTSPRALGVLSYFTRHRTAANLLMLCLIVVGLATLPRMRAQFFPDVVLESVTVSVAWQGAGAEDVDAGIVQLLEPALLAVEGVAETSARSSEGRATISVEFEPGWDMGRALDEVQLAVDAVSDLPAEADPPELRRDAWRDLVTDVVITGPVGVDQLARLADEMVVRLFAVGVTRTTIRGVAAPQTIIEVPAAALVEHDVSMAEIAAVIGAAADTAPAGDISGGNARVRTGTQARSPAEIGALVLRARPDGTALAIADIATLRVEGADRERAYFVGDNPAITLRVDRSAQGDAIGIQRLVEGVVSEMRPALPAGTSIDLVRTRAEFISGRLDVLIDNGLLGLGLVLALLFLFLNARTAFWVAAGIPVAMLTTVALMYAAGLTLNMISLFALIITLGIIVDDAIVVGEHADFRARTLGEGPVEAAENAARRMAAPVFSATITTVLAFFALAAIGGQFGNLINDIPFTVIAVLLASLVECFLILPHHMSRALLQSAREHWYDAPSRLVNRGFVWVQRRLFRPAMGLVIAARYVVLAGAVALLAMQVAALVRGDVPWRFFNAPESGSITGNFAMLPGAGRADTLAMMREMQRAAEAVAARYEAEHGLNPLAYVIAEVGGNAGRGMAGADTKDADQLGSIAIELIDADLRPYSQFAFVSDLQDEVRRHPMAETVTFRGARSGPGGDALDIELFGADASTLKRAAEAVKLDLAAFPEVSALEDSLAYDKQELVLDLAPQGAALGFTTDGLARVLRQHLNGIEAATYPDGTRSATIRVELPARDIGADFLQTTWMRAPDGAYLPLADLVSVESRTGFSTVRRENGLRIVSVTGDLSEDVPARAEEVILSLRETILPGVEERFGVGWRLSGLAEQESDFLSDALTGLVLCLVGIYFTLAWIFSSWTRPLVVMAVIPFGLIGAVHGHAVWDVSLSMFSIVGLLGMTGIIINDSIVLVSTVDDYAERRGLVPAIIDAATDRLRPVLLTTLTTVLGLAPLLYESSSQAQFLKPTVITLVYGLGFGMVLVLVLVPALLAMQLDAGRQARALGRALRAGRRAPRLALMVRGAGLALAGLLAALAGPVLLGGTLHAPLAAALPEGAAALPLALGLFVACAAGLLLTLYLGVLVARLTRRRSP